MKNKAYTKLSAALIVLSLINLAVSLVFIMALPDKVPTHFTADMVCDGEGSKWNGLIFSVVIAVIMPLGLFMAKKTANVEKNSKPLFISLPVIEIVLIALNWLINSLMKTNVKPGEKAAVNFMWLMPLVFSVLYIIIGNIFPTVRHNRALGLRLPWTLKNKNCWNLTHRFAGKITVLTGIVLAVLTIVMKAAGSGDVFFFTALMVSVGIITIIPSVYAFTHRNA